MVIVKKKRCKKRDNGIRGAEWVPTCIERAHIHSKNAVDYLSGYLEESDQTPQISLEKVLQAAALAEAMLERKIAFVEA